MFRIVIIMRNHGNEIFPNLEKLISILKAQITLELWHQIPKELQTMLLGMYGITVIYREAAKANDVD